MESGATRTCNLREKGEEEEQPKEEIGEAASGQKMQSLKERDRKFSGHNRSSRGDPLNAIDSQENTWLENLPGASKLEPHVVGNRWWQQDTLHVQNSQGDEEDEDGEEEPTGEDGGQLGSSGSQPTRDLGGQSSVEVQPEAVCLWKPSWNKMHSRTGEPLAQDLQSQPTGDLGAQSSVKARPDAVCSVEPSWTKVLTHTGGTKPTGDLGAQSSVRTKPDAACSEEPSWSSLMEPSWINVLTRTGGPNAQAMKTHGHADTLAQDSQPTGDSGAQSSIKAMPDVVNMVEPSWTNMLTHAGGARAQAMQPTGRGDSLGKDVHAQGSQPTGVLGAQSSVEAKPDTEGSGEPAWINLMETSWNNVLTHTGGTNAQAMQPTVRGVFLAQHFQPTGDLGAQSSGKAEPDAAWSEESSCSQALGHSGDEVPGHEVEDRLLSSLVEFFLLSIVNQLVI